MLLLWPAVQRWLLYGPLYRFTQRVLHRLNLHHMPPKPGIWPGWISGGCDWCGIRVKSVSAWSLLGSAPSSESSEQTINRLRGES